ncbi:MAG: hypothetical protein AAGM38_18095 [Pseudomonadota bacterium]
MIDKRRFVCALTALAISAAQPAHSAASSALSGSYSFDVTWSLFPELKLASGTAQLVEVDGGYEMRLSAQARLTVPAVDWRGEFAVRGEGDLGDGLPLRFERRSTRPDLQTAVVVEWSEPGAPPITDTFVLPAGYTIKRDPVDPAKIVDVLDPLSFMAHIMGEVERTNGESCDLTATTWDGVRLATIEISTVESVPSTRTDCQVIYRSIDGLRSDSPWRAEEASTRRILRFERKGLRWEPQFFRIEGVFLGYTSTFTTNITPLDR